MRASSGLWVTVACGLAVLLLGACSSEDGDDGGSGGGGGTGAAGASGAGAGGTAGGSGSGPMFDAGSDPARNDVAAGAVCDRFAEILCAGEEFCCSAPGRDRAACESDVGTSCKGDPSLDDISGNPITGFDAAMAKSAFMGLETRASMCDPQVGEWGVSTSGFLGTVAGTVAAGGDCKPDMGLSNPDTGTIFAALASCSDPGSTACLPATDDSTWTCTARAAAGGACFWDLNCQDGMFCDPPLDPNGACTARKAVGETCFLPNECQSFICKGGTCAEANADNAYCPG